MTFPSEGAAMENGKRPKTRADCLAGGFNAERPCPYVGCVYHISDLIAGFARMFSPVMPEKRFHQLGDEFVSKLKALPTTCILDEIDKKPEMTLIDIANLINATRERVRQIDVIAYRAFKRHWANRGGLD